MQNKDYTEYGTSSETGSAWGDADATVSGVAAHAGGVVLLRPYSFMTRCFTLPDLFAGKMHALVYRSWNKRVKGRDWYDFEWYVRHQIPLNFQHLQARISEFNNESPDLLTFKNILYEKLMKTDINAVKQDVMPYVKNPQELTIWSNEYFLQLAERIVWKQE